VAGKFWSEELLAGEILAGELGFLAGRGNFGQRSFCWENFGGGIMYLHNFAIWSLLFHITRPPNLPRGRSPRVSSSLIIEKEAPVYLPK
jgi:hypothetical protein